MTEKLGISGRLARLFLDSELTPLLGVSALLLGLFLAWMHPILPIYGLLFGALLGVAMGVVALLANGDSRFPFGPALSLGAMAAIWLHEPILRGLG